MPFMSRTSDRRKPAELQLMKTFPPRASIPSMRSGMPAGFSQMAPIGRSGESLPFQGT